MRTAPPHRWSAWTSAGVGLVERRCAACGAVERTTVDALVETTVAAPFAGLRAFHAALGAVFPLGRAVKLP
jgi:hypothetical protein